MLAQMDREVTHLLDKIEEVQGKFVIRNMPGSHFIFYLFEHQQYIINSFFETTYSTPTGNSVCSGSSMILA